jgi:U4/U6 small nuclear ribonucleoprotein PRP31
MTDVDAAMNQGIKSHHGLLEDDPDYKLVVECNKLIHDIEDNINMTQKYVAEIYSKKFPELESIIPNKLDYIKTVLRIKNEMDMTLIELNDILPSAVVMIVSVTGSTTSGKPLDDNDLDKCLRGCEEVYSLEEDKGRILKFVESRMNKISPNMCAMIGTFLSAQLMGLAGGLTALSQIPADNFQVIGQEKRNLAGFSRLTSMPNTGILYYADLVQNCPPLLRKKALKVLGNKVALAVRCDAYNNHPDGSEGQRLNDELVEKFDKWTEPQQARTKKALPIPEEKRKSKRGGKRVRKFKERFAMTDLRAQQNKIKMSLSDGEYGDSAMGNDFGMVGNKDTGKIRAPVRKEVKLTSKKLKSMSAPSGQVSGLSSSLAFTPVQGIELVNPNAAADRIKEANNKWFNTNSGFLSAVPK